MIIGHLKEKKNCDLKVTRILLVVKQQFLG